MWGNKLKFRHLAGFGFYSLILIAGCAEKRFPAGDFFAVVVSDTHISRDESKDERLRKLLRQINTRQLGDVHLVFNTGDAVSRIFGDYTDSNRDTEDDRLQRYLDIISGSEVPVYTALGNHDYKIGPNVDSDGPFSKDQIEFAESLWQTKGDIYPYFSLDYNGWKFIILNSMRGRYRERNFEPQQIEWLSGELQTQMPSILFFHHPVETDNLKFWCSFDDLITEEKEPEFFALCRQYKNNITLPETEEVLFT